jgi:hypothetical protein
VGIERRRTVKTAATPKLKRIDLTKGEGHNHPDIKTGKVYLARIGSTYHCGKFSKQWYGWNFDGWSHNSVGLQYDQPGTNASKWQGLWELT